MADIWQAAYDGDLAEVERLVGHDPGLLDAKDEQHGQTPLMGASFKSHVEVVRWLLDQGAATNVVPKNGQTALFLACDRGNPLVVQLLLERGADPTITDHKGVTPLILASFIGYLEVVRLLLGHTSADIIISQRHDEGGTAPWEACYKGQRGVVEALLESGADPTIANIDGITPMDIAKEDAPPPDPDKPRFDVSTEGRRECVAALEVRHYPLLSLSPSSALLY
jgi:ankyrin repeat protein